MRIGIVGSGIGGLAAAYWLSRQGHQITLFERHDSLGMAAHEFQMVLPNGQRLVGDVPSRMFNRQLWPGLLALYEEIGVEVEAVDPSQSFCDMNGRDYLCLETAYRPWQLMKDMLNRKSRLILGDAKRLLDEGTLDLKSGLASSITLGEYLENHHYSREFKFGFIFPTLASTVCTCSYAALEQYPAVIILDTLSKLTTSAAGNGERPLLWKTKYGSSDVVKKLAGQLPDIQLGRRVDAVVRNASQVTVHSHSADSQAPEAKLDFDHVIMATQANTSLRLVRTLTVDEKRMLGSFKYEEIVIKIHRDSGLMPANRKKWATFNQTVCDSEGDVPAAMCTVLMNQFHSNWPMADPVFQTIGPIVSLAESDTLETIVIQRPVVTRSSWNGWELRDQLHAEADRRVWFCGSYASPGVPLLETAIKSVLDLRLLGRSTRTMCDCS